MHWGDEYFGVWSTVHARSGPSGSSAASTALLRRVGRHSDDFAPASDDVCPASQRRLLQSRPSPRSSALSPSCILTVWPAEELLPGCTYLTSIAARLETAQGATWFYSASVRISSSSLPPAASGSI